MANRIFDFTSADQNARPPASPVLTEIRKIRERDGLSLTDIAKLTYYSKSSWQRWLEGQRPITDQAVRRFATAFPDDADRILGLWALEADGEASTSQAELADDVAAAVERLAESTELSETSPTPALMPLEPLDPPSSAATPTRRLKRTSLIALTAAIAVLAGAWLTIALATSHGRPHNAARGVTAPTSAPACRAGGCLDQDPEATGCVADGRIIAVRNIQKVLVWLKYSPRCSAAWAKITDAAPGDTATITSSTGQSETALIHYGLDAYSHMVDASPGTTVQVCGTQPAGTGCTMAITDAADAPPVSVPGAVPSATTSSSS